MTAMTVAERMTAEEYMARPEDELGRPVNLVEGEVVLSQATPFHGELQIDVLVALKLWCRERPGRGRVFPPIDVLVDEFNVYAPDVSWYAEGRVLDVHSRPSPMPDLAVEVRSPSTWRYDIGAKKAGYERRGLPELWLVDTAGPTVFVYRRSRAERPVFDVALELTRGDTLSSPLLPGFALPIDQLAAAS